MVNSELSEDRKKDRIIIDLSKYTVTLNGIVVNCMSEIESKDDYAKRLEDKLK